MKKLLYLFFTVALATSCSKSSDEGVFKDNLEYADYEISYQQSGDVDKINSIVIFTSTLDHFYEKNNSKKLGFNLNLSSKVQGSTKKLEYIVTTKQLVIGLNNSIEEEYKNDNVSVEFQLIVKRDKKEVFNQSYKLDKNNLEESVNLSFTKNSK